MLHALPVAVAAFETICEHLNIRCVPTVRDNTRTDLLTSGRLDFSLVRDFLGLR